MSHLNPTLDPDDSLYALFLESHDDPRNPKHRNHEGSKDDQEEQRQWLEHSCIIASKEWLDEAEALRIEPKPILDPNGELKSISLINITHPSLEKALDKINPGVTNLWEILDNECQRHGMMETMFFPMDIHEESTLELEKEDYINEHGRCIIIISSNPCSQGKSPKLIDLSTTTHEIFNPPHTSRS